jgi:O-antigen/teichoic acid export membrane protein
MVDYAQYYREGRLADIVALIHRAMEKCAILLLPIMAILLCVAPELMRFLFGKPYEASAIPFRVYLMNLPVRTFTFGAVLLATGNSRYVFVEAVLSLVSNAVFAWLAIHLIGPLWASAGAVIALYFFDVPYVTFAIHKVLQCRVRDLFPWSKMAKLTAASFLATPAVLLLKAVGAGWPDVVLLAAACAVYGAITFPVFVVCGWMPFSPKNYLARWRR